VGLWLVVGGVTGVCLTLFRGMVLFIARGFVACGDCFAIVYILFSYGGKAKSFPMFLSMITDSRYSGDHPAIVSSYPQTLSRSNTKAMR